MTQQWLFPLSKPSKARYYVAMSAMQKLIRRGYADEAVHNAEVLFRYDKHALRRRLLTIMLVRADTPLPATNRRRTPCRLAAARYVSRRPALRVRRSRRWSLYGVRGAPLEARPQKCASHRSNWLMLLVTREIDLYNVCRSREVTAVIDVRALSARG